VRSLTCRGPLLRSMKNAQELNAVAPDSVNDNIWRAWDDKLAGFSLLAGTTLFRISAENLDGFVDSAAHLVREPTSALPLDVRRDMLQVDNCIFGPAEPHQERSEASCCSNQARTCSSSIKRPASADAMPCSTALRKRCSSSIPRRRAAAATCSTVRPVRAAMSASSASSSGVTRTSICRSVAWPESWREEIEEEIRELEGDIVRMLSAVGR
jgi:hypothetical protein